ncbi:glycosyltransferase family 2 protein [Tepidamorphus sp. 3E244]|uniref:glycosyltransferase family 2 protein n=1 Tax=Tepidamorphus sp. 3E244 TaxID=3385498 RepID=UPI0038FCB220
MTSAPTVSIIISAYNRPQVVSYAIRSVLANTFEDFELIVIGDGCNAETEDAIRAFDDPRIHFENLPENSGHQSTPHNRGLELARGEFVLFLNQDDLYFPDHIGARIDFMRTTGAPFSWSPVLLVQQSAHETGPPVAFEDLMVLDGPARGGKYDPRIFIISSCWAVRREVCARVGPWLQKDETRLSPSQEWIFRAHRAGLSPVYHPHVSVICIHSGVRRYSYLNPRSFEHERAWDWLQGGADARLKLMETVALQQASELFATKLKLEARRKPIRSSIERKLERRGVHPDAFQRALAGMSPGEWVSDHAKSTMIAPKIKPGRVVDLSAKDGEILLGDGWTTTPHDGPAIGARTAELFLVVDATADEQARWTATLHPAGAGAAALEVSINNAAFAQPDTHDGALRLAFDGPGPHYIQLRHPNRTGDVQPVAMKSLRVDPA